MPGDLSGSALPVYIPLITDVANIQNGLRNFYYGTASAVSDEGSIEAYSIAGRIKDLRDTKLNIDSGTAITQLSISHATLPKLILTRGANTTTLQNSTAANVTLTMPATTGTLALTTESTMTNLATVGSSASTLTLGGTTTTTYSIGTSALSSGTKTINLGAASDTTTKNINIGTGASSSTTTIAIGSNSGATSIINSYGTLTHTGAATATISLSTPKLVVSGTTGISLTNTSTITADGTNVQIVTDDIDPAVDLAIGSMFIKKGAAWDSSLWMKTSAGTGSDKWRKMRGNMWFSGTSSPSAGIGEQSGDFFYNRVTGEVWQAI